MRIPSALYETRRVVIGQAHAYLTGLNSVLVYVRPSRNLGKWKGKDGELEETGHGKEEPGRG